ncbi:MAG: helix-turn-helix domain-containing protein, partial [Alphaproteobacteria bacterium]
YSGNKITVPLGPSSTSRQRIKQLREMIAKGASVNTIVRKLRVARRTVYRHKVSARGTKNDGQLKLF